MQLDLFIIGYMESHFPSESFTLNTLPADITEGVAIVIGEPIKSNYTNRQYKTNIELIVRDRSQKNAYLRGYVLHEQLTGIRKPQTDPNIYIASIDTVGDVEFVLEEEGVFEVKVDIAVKYYK